MYIQTRENPMRKVLKKNVRAKNGTEIEAGTTVELEFPKEHHGMIVRMSAEGKTVAIRTVRMNKYFGTRLPSMKQLEKWTFDSVCKSVGGKTVEPDGWDCNGTPSWLLAMGLI
jgi:hypothetical protein